MEIISGVDVSKATFDVLTLRSGKEKYVKYLNKTSDFERFYNALNKGSVAKIVVCMEATGLFYEGLAEFLHAKGVVVYVVNGRRIKGFAGSEEKRSKTDKIDAGVIARFCRAHLNDLIAWKPATKAVRKLQSLTRQISSLKEDRARQKVRLKSALLCPEVIDSIKAHIEFLSESIRKLESATDALMDDNEEIKKKKDLAESIKGVGQVTSSVILAEFRLFSDFTERRQVAAFAGLDVSEWTSGSSVVLKPRISKKGNPRVRQVLYMAAMAARRSNPVIKDFYNRLRASGKNKMQSLCACMRKLVELIFAVVTSGKPFDPQYQPVRPGQI